MGGANETIAPGLVQQLALSSPNPGANATNRTSRAGDSSLSAASAAQDALGQLPVIDLGGAKTLSAGEMQDLEDHAELDPLLEKLIRDFADKLQKATERAAHAASARPPRAPEPPTLS